MQEEQERKHTQISRPYQTSSLKFWAANLNDEKNYFLTNRASKRSETDYLPQCEEVLGVVTCAFEMFYMLFI